MAKDAYYFSHDSSSQDDPKCMLLIDQLGMEGYGIFWALIEKLRNETDYKLPLAITGSYAKRWGTSKEKVDTVIKNYGLFVLTEHHFFSERLLRSMNKKTEIARNAALLRWGNNTENQQLITDGMQTHSFGNANGMQNDAIKVKESKGKESKESDSGVPPHQPKNNLIGRQKWFYDEVARFKDSYPKELLRNFYEYWIEPNKSKTKMRFEMQKTWDLNLRLKKWASNDFNKTKPKQDLTKPYF